MALQPPYKRVRERRSSRQGAPFVAGGVREYERIFRVEMTDHTEDSNVVCMAPGIPLPFSPYVSEDGKCFDLNSLAVRHDARRVSPDDGGEFNWDVTVRYSTEMPPGGPPVKQTGFGGDPRGPQNNPQDEPPDIEWDWEIIREAPAKDLDGKPFLNSALQPFSPAPTFEKAIAVLVYTRNELTHSRAEATKYAFAVNVDPFLGAPPGCAQCYPVRAKLMFRGPMSFWRKTYRIRFGAPKYPEGGRILVEVGTNINDLVLPVSGRNAKLVDELETWQPQILDAGLMELQAHAARSHAGQPVPIRVNGQPISTPVCLNGHGRKQLAVDGVIEPVYLKFRRYRDMPFGRLLVSGIAGL